MEEHIVAQHTKDQQKLQCSVCGTKYTQKKNFLRHLGRASGTRCRSLNAQLIAVAPDVPNASTFPNDNLEDPAGVGPIVDGSLSAASDATDDAHAQEDGQNAMALVAPVVERKNGKRRTRSSVSTFDCTTLDLLPPKKRRKMTDVVLVSLPRDIGARYLSKDDRGEITITSRSTSVEDPSMFVQSDALELDQYQKPEAKSNTVAPKMGRKFDPNNDVAPVVLINANSTANSTSVPSLNRTQGKNG